MQPAATGAQQEARFPVGVESAERTIATAGPDRSLRAAPRLAPLPGRAGPEGSHPVTAADTQGNAASVHRLHRPAHAEWEVGGLHEREWLLTDGLGGYACGNPLEVPARRYHAWFCTVPADGARRVRFVQNVDERLRVLDGRQDGPEVALSAAWWRALPEPSVPRCTVQFHAHPLPTWVRRGDGFAIERTLALPQGRRCALVRWRNLGQKPVRLSLRPQFCLEEADHLRRERPLDGAVQARGASWGFRPDPALPTVWLSADGVAAFVSEPTWYRDYWLPIEAARGYDATGDRWSPGVLQLDLAPGQGAVVALAIGEPVDEPTPLYRAELARRLSRIEWANHDDDPLAQRLRHGIDDFFVRDPQGRLGVLAGFPWFAEWGRDTFVALPGLTLAVDDVARCLEVLRGVLPFLREGLLPNVYGRSPQDSHYDSADAALWFALAVQRLQDGGHDAAAIDREFGDALASIVAACDRGTALGLRVDDAGLLHAGSRDLNATWMDARTTEGPVTPRGGQPVEIAALWCSLLQHLGELRGEPWRSRAVAAGRAFVQRFWREDAGCLFDCIGEDGPDARIRPNMVIAAALPRSPLSQQQRASIVAVAERDLVTPRGLRTLAPGDPGYRARYAGDQRTRDRSYHQGTVWPWLAGFYVEAALRSASDADGAARRAALLAWLHGFVPEVQRCGIDHVSEVFDGDPPHEPGGTFAQAWNTGELLRAVRLCRQEDAIARAAPTPAANAASTGDAGEVRADRADDAKTASSKVALSQTAPSQTAPSQTAPSQTGPSQTAPSKDAPKRPGPRQRRGKR